jgi:FKBP-type peptidyl-prolyl cis-trans isomerase 2
MDKKVRKGDTVEILYTGKLEDGEIFDSTEEKEPFVFISGGKEVISGMSKAVNGMKVGEKKVVDISPDDAYGEYRDELLGKVPQDVVPEGAKIGDPLSDAENEGQVYYVRELTAEHVIIDGNHPLAGKVLTFDIEVLSIT